MVITVTAEFRPHVVTAVVEVGDDRLAIPVGQGTRANLLQFPQLTLTWAPPRGGEYHLIIDCFADRVDELDEQGVSTVSLIAERGILHRLAELSTPGPSCVSL
ncbi:MAG: hypothetical protein ABIP99_07060 [Ilumatobacteraceae bacterium]